MLDAKLSVKRFIPEYKKEIIQLLNSEWNYSEKYFDWKYQSPYKGFPVGWVAIHRRKIVGFRGLMSRNFSYLDNQKIVVLSLADGFIHKDYRRKGVFSHLNQYLVKDLAEEWAKENVRGFVYTLSSNHLSTPVYLKLGWTKISQKKILIYRNFSGFVMNKGYSKKAIRFFIDAFNRIVEMFRYSNDSELKKYKLIIKEDIYSNSMSILNKICTDCNKLTQDKDAAYYSWRISNPNEEYKIAYLIDKSKRLCSYAIFQTRGSICSLIDYSYLESIEFEILMSNYIRREKPKMLYTLGIGKSKDSMDLLRNLGFGENRMASAFPNFFSKIPVNQSFIALPVSLEKRESNWIFGNYNLKDINNWDLSLIDDDGS